MVALQLFGSTLVCSAVEVHVQHLTVEEVGEALHFFIHHGRFAALLR